MLRWKLDELMARKHVKNTQLAEKLGIHRNAVANLRRDHPQMIPVKHMEVICRELDIQPAELFEYTPEVGGAEAEDQRLQEAIKALEQEGGPVFRSDEDAARVVRERAQAAAEDLKGGNTKGLQDILAGHKPAAGK